MKNLTIVCLLILGSFKAHGQRVSLSDSLKVMEALEQVFQMFEKPDYAQFEKASTDSIYCTTCFKGPEGLTNGYFLDRKIFFSSHLASFQMNEMKRARKSTKIHLFSQKSEVSEIIAFIEIWKKDEIVLGHEGGSIGLHFKQDNQRFRFSGIEFVP
jgi:hypothetical protein